MDCFAAADLEVHAAAARQADVFEVFERRSVLAYLGATGLGFRFLVLAAGASGAGESLDGGAAAEDVRLRSPYFLYVYLVASA